MIFKKQKQLVSSSFLAAAGGHAKETGRIFHGIDRGEIVAEVNLILMILLYFTQIFFMLKDAK